MKIGFFITARLKSERLPNKILLDLNGQSVLDHVIGRCKSLENIDGVVLATSTNPQDSVLYNIALSNEIQFYPGLEDDVLVRLETAALYYGYDAFLSITADNPLFSLNSSKMVLDKLRRGVSDFVFSKGLPMGCNVTGIQTQALQVANRMKNNTNTEIWGPFVNRSDFFSISEIVIMNAPYGEKKRLTIDYPEDYNLFLKLFGLYDKKSIPPTREILEYLKLNPGLWEINSKRMQRFPTQKEIQAIHTSFDNQVKSGKNYALSIGKELKPLHQVTEVPF